jgi:hypothetical protein
MIVNQGHAGALLRSVALAGLLAVAPSCAWGKAPLPLPPAAQQALALGVGAARAADFPLAIRHFDNARKLAPLAPVVYLNLALAESNLPGRELRSIAWFGAYLAAMPKAPNFVALRNQMLLLNERNRSNVARVLKATEDAAGQLSGNQKSSVLADVAWLCAKAGDPATALRIADRIENAGVQRNAREQIAQATAARSGNLPPGTAPQQSGHYDGVGRRPAFWVSQLDSDNRYLASIPLNSPPFLELGAYLKSGRFLDVMQPMSKQDDPSKISANDMNSPSTVFYGFYATAQALALGQYDMDRMLHTLFAELSQ